MTRSWRAAIGAVATAAALLVVPTAAQAKTWTPPEGAEIVKVKVTKTKTHHHKRKVVTKITYRTFDYWTPTHADLIGSIECKADTQYTVESDWYLADHSEPVRDHVQFLIGTCRTTWVQVAPISNVSIGFEWKTSWIQTMDIDPVGVWYTPWEVEGIQTLPQIPIPTTHVKTITKTVRTK